YTRQMGDAVVNIFKVLADLDITEKRKPQDGSFSAEVSGQAPNLDVMAKAQAEGKEAKGEGFFDAEEERSASASRTVDFRVATAGSVVGEKLVMRILDRSRQVTSLGQLGMRDRMRDQIRAIAMQPHGMLIVCGPTGAGKSTTLYACMAEIDRYQKNVITV